MTPEGMQMGKLLVAAGRALDHPTKKYAARTVLFKLTKHRDITVYKIGGEGWPRD